MPENTVSLRRKSFRNRIPLCDYLNTRASPVKSETPGYHTGGFFFQPLTSYDHENKSTGFRFTYERNFENSFPLCECPTANRFPLCAKIGFRFGRVWPRLADPVTPYSCPVMYESNTIRFYTFLTYFLQIPKMGGKPDKIGQTLAPCRSHRLN